MYSNPTPNPGVVCLCHLNRRGLPFAMRVPMRAGFSLIEIMIVIVIIGMLAGTVTLSTKHYVNKARYNRAKSDIRVIQTAIENYYAEHARYPSTAEGLGVVDGLELRNDPWKNPYDYVSPGTAGDYDVISYGADGRDGGIDFDADLTQADLDGEGP